VRRTVGLAALLLRINRTAVNVAIGIVFVAIVAGSFIIGLMDLLETAHVQAEVLADNSTAAIVFQDREAASRLLASLRHSPQVQFAELLGVDNRSFARYVRTRPAAPANPAAQAEPDRGISPFFLRVHQDIAGPDGRIGMLNLTVGIDPLLRQTGWIAVITLIAAAISLWVSSLLLRHLDASVLAPLQALNALARLQGMCRESSTEFSAGLSPRPHPAPESTSSAC